MIGAVRRGRRSQRRVRTCGALTLPTALHTDSIASCFSGLKHKPRQVKMSSAAGLCQTQVRRKGMGVAVRRGVGGGRAQAGINSWSRAGSPTSQVFGIAVLRR